MGRIEEIKGRSETVHPLNQMDFENPSDIAITWTRNYWKDTQYLLAKLEIAEKALESIDVPMPGSRDNQLVLYYERKAAEALKAIREGE